MGQHRHYLGKQHKASYLNKGLRDWGWHLGFLKIQAAGPRLSVGRLLSQQALYPLRPPNQRSFAGLSGCPGLLWLCWRNCLALWKAELPSSFQHCPLSLPPFA